MALGEEGYRIDACILERAYEIVRIEIRGHVGNVLGGMKVQVNLASTEGRVRDHRYSLRPDQLLAPMAKYF